MQIYIAEGTQQTGPFDLEAVRQGMQSGRYSPTQLAWYEGAPGWQPLTNVPGLQAAAAPAAATPPPAAPVPPAAPANPAYPTIPSQYSSQPQPSAPGLPGGVPPGPYVPPAAPTKKGLGATLGGVVIGLLVVLGGLAKIARFSNLFSSHQPYRTYDSSPSYSSSTPAPATSPMRSASPYNFFASNTPAPTAPLHLRTAYYYNNANQFPTGELQQHYVNFKFNYPADFLLASGARVAHKEDFVEVDHQINGNSVETFYVEDFFTGEPSLAAALPTVGQKFVNSLYENSKKKTPNLQMMSQGTVKFKNFAAYEYGSQWATQDKNGRTFYVFSRYLIVAPPAGKNGVILETIATSDTPGVKSIDDMVKTPGMATMLDSFIFL